MSDPIKTPSDLNGFNKTTINSTPPNFNKGANLAYWGNMPALYSENTTSWPEWMHFIEGWAQDVFTQLATGLNETQDNLNITVDDVNKTLNDWRDDINSILNNWQIVIDSIPENIRQQVITLATPVIKEQIDLYVKNTMPTYVHALVQQDIANELDARDQKISKEIHDEKSNLNKLDYKMVSIAMTSTQTPIISDHIISHLNIAKTDVTFVPLVYIDDLHATTLKPQDISRLQTFVDTIKNQTPVHVRMLKPHIATTARGDAFDRATYDPSDYNLFFANWKTVLLQYAAFASQNNIDILCIGVEQYLTTRNQYVSNWKDITSAIRSAYPDLKLTYAMNTTEQLNPSTNWDMIQYLDYAGLNVYPKYTTDPDYTKQTPEILSHAWNGDNHYTQINWDWIVSEIKFRYGKDSFITETGLYSVDDGLVWFLSQLKNPKFGNFNVTKLAIQTMRLISASNPQIRGIAWWGFGGEFGVIPLDDGNNITTVAEDEISDWFNKEV